MIRVLLILQQAFSLWMLVDAIKRGAKSHWYFVVMMPFGEWVYFFKVKIHDPEFEPIRAFYKRLTTKKVTIKQLRYQLEQTPSYASHLALAQGLHDKELAEEHFALAIRIQGEEREALYGLALSRSAQGEHEAAMENYRRLIELEPAFRDYAAWPDLAHLLCAAGRFEEAFELLETLVVKSPRLGHRVLFAHYLMEGGRSESAREQLEKGMTEYEHAPKFIRRKDRLWAGRAKKMLKVL